MSQRYFYLFVAVALLVAGGKPPVSSRFSEAQYLAPRSPVEERKSVLSFARSATQQALGEVSSVKIKRAVARQEAGESVHLKQLLGVLEHARSLGVEIEFKLVKAQASDPKVMTKVILLVARIEGKEIASLMQPAAQRTLRDDEFSAAAAEKFFDLSTLKAAATEEETASENEPDAEIVEDAEDIEAYDALWEAFEAQAQISLELDGGKDLPGLHSALKSIFLASPVAQSPKYKSLSPADLDALIYVLIAKMFPDLEGWKVRKEAASSHLPRFEPAPLWIEMSL